IGLSGDYCAYQLSAPGRDFGASGGNATLNVTAAPCNCGWTAESNSNWITITSSGNGAVNYSVAANTAYSPRTGTLTIADHCFVVIQTGLIDTAAPVVTLKVPTTAVTFQTEAGLPNLSGVATDNDRVTEVS